MKARLSTSEFVHYRRLGFVVKEQVFSPVQLNALRAAADAAVAQARDMVRAEDARSYVLDGNRFVDVGHITVQFEHHAQAQDVRVIEPVHELHAAFERLVDDARLVQPMCQLVGVDRVSLWTAKLNVKGPQRGSGFAWHQDSPYWIHDNHDVERLPNVMLNFDDSCVANGCLRLIPASHKLGMLPGCSDARQLAGFYTDPACFDDNDQVAVEVPAGSLVFFDPLVVHGSSANTSKRPRRGIILTYQPADRPTLKRGNVRNADS